MPAERHPDASAGPPSAMTAATAATPPPAGRSLPASIGPYRIISFLGEGGFGVVYLAEQIEPVRRRVALKVIRPGMDSAAVIARFEAERQALAMMDHPCIARVLDAGTTPPDQGERPYFAMEFVQGEPINAYCDRQRLSLRDRLGLFAQVCDAVHHAHSKGILHRDLKPSNILVSVSDRGSAHPVVIDFGVAKALHSRLTDRSLFTEQGALIGTPEYMSPEQAEMSALDVDTRSDIYSLGVILYELLTGLLPFDPATLRSAGIAGIQKIIRESEPPRPSVRITGADAAALGVARQTRPADLARQLRSELEWIPLMAMRKDRLHRYRSAAEFADDIANYLAGRPLIAGPESRAYRIRKFIRRHRVGVVAAIAFASLLIAAVVVTSLTARWALREKSATEVALDQADWIARFMEQTLSAAGPAVAKGRDSSILREMLDSAAQRLEAGELSAAPSAELRVRATIGDTLMQIGQLDAAERVLAPALDLARRQHPVSGPDRGLHEEVAIALNNLGSLASRQGRVDRAIELLAESLAIRRQTLSVDQPELAVSLNNLAQAHRQRGETALALRLTTEALEIWRRSYQRDHEQIATALGNLGALQDDLGRSDEAEALLAESLEMTRRLNPGDHPRTALAINNLAIRRQSRGDFAGAEPMFIEAAAMLRRLNPDGSADLAAAVSNLGFGKHMRGDPAAAEPLYAEALAIRRRMLPPDHADIAATLNNLGSISRERGDWARAEPLMREAIEIYRRTLPADHPSIAFGLNNLASVLRESGRASEAEPLNAEAVTILRRKLAANHGGLWRAISEYGLTLARLERREEAERLLLEADAGLLASQNVRPTWPIESARRLADLYKSWDAASPAPARQAAAAEWAEVAARRSASTPAQDGR